MHTMILGMTESGKSTLGKILAANLHAQRKHVVVLDPMYDPDWKCSLKTSDMDELKDYLHRNQRCYVFIEESGRIFNEGNDLSNAWLTTYSRHFGHSVSLLAQRAVQIPPTIRDQTHRVHLFTSSLNDGKIHASEWNKPILQTCHTLPKLEFMSADRYGLCVHRRIVNYREIVDVGGNSDARPSDHKRGRLGREMDERKAKK